MLETCFSWLLGFVFLYLLTVFYGRKRKEGEPPLIKGWIPYLGKIFEFGQDAHKFLLDLKEKHGDVFTVLIGGKYMTFVMDPVMYPSVIKHAKQLDFHEFSDKVSSATFGYPSIRSPRFPGLCEQIQKCYALLKGENLSSLAESLVRNLKLVLEQDQVSQWKTDDLYGFTSRVIFETTFMTLYGKSARDSRHDGMAARQEVFERFDAFLPLLIAGVPISLLPRAKAARFQLTSFLSPQQLATWTAPSRFIQRRTEVFEQYHTLRDSDRAGHHFTILWASVGNTIPAAFWTLYHLLTHPEAFATVRDEIHHALESLRQREDKDQAAELDFEQVDGLLYLGSAIRESLRLSAASMNIRVVQEDFTLQLASEYSASVRRGDIIALYPQSMHMDPEIFEDPETYQFDRFVKDGQEKQRFYKRGQKLKYFCMPFGSGSTKCPGRYLAIHEIKRFLILLLMHFDMELLEGQAPVLPHSGRVGLGILLPDSSVRFRYRQKPT